MRLRNLLLVPLLMLSLGACETLATAGFPAGGGSTATAPLAGTLRDEQALYAVEAAYEVAATAYLAADSRGQMSADVKARARAYLIQAAGALELAREARRIGNGEALRANTALVRAAVDSAAALIPRN